MMEPGKLPAGVGAGTAAGGANTQDSAMNQAGQWGNAQQQMISNGMGFGMNGGVGGFGAMGWNNQVGFDPTMQSMQNGTGNGSWGAHPNMMGT